MTSQHEILIERFVEALISGQRPAARAVVDECLSADAPAEMIVERLFWPALDQIEKLFRHDQLAVLSHQLATRLLRMLADQMQMRLEQAEPNGRTILLVCGPNEPNELAAQMAGDMLEAAGYAVCFAGGGVANDEIIQAVGELKPHALTLFSSVPGDLPEIRVLIDQMRDTGIADDVQIVVGGGVFNRADGLAEEIGADLWANSPADLVEQVNAQPERRMAADQRTVGRRRRQGKAA